MRTSIPVWLLFGLLSLAGTNAAPAQSGRTGVGAIPYSNGVTFRVWAPHATNVSVAGNFNGWDMAANKLVGEANGYWSADVTNAAAGAEYKYVINSNLWRKDPRGLSVVNSGGNSIVFNPNRYKWDVPSFSRPERKDMVVYKMHVLTYSPGYVQSPYGNFNMAADKLDHLQELGVNTIELMPVAEFPGNNSWGYNPADPYAVESAYGGSAEFQRFVDACHTRKMAVLLDVVHNHWGPTDLATWQFDGYAPDVNYGGIYHYNTPGLCCTPWGSSRPDYSNAEVRDYIKDSYATWLEAFHVDGFRTDSPYHIGYYQNTEGAWPGNADGVNLMKEVNGLLHNSYSNVISIQENGDATWDFDARWDMDFLEDLRALVADPSDANRDMNALAGLIESGAGLGRVVYVESHDTAGDLNGNTRLTRLIDAGDPTSFWARKRSLLAAAVYLTSPGIPMIFQGEEMAENWSFSDRTGYRWDATTAEQHRGHIAAYKDLVHARRNLKGGTQGLKGSNCDVTHIDNNNKVIAYKRWDAGGDDVVVVANFGITAWTNNDYSIEFPSAGTWYVHFNSDQTSYYSDFNQIGPATVAAAGSPPKANINMGRYSALILSKTAPATSGRATASPCNNGCDAPVTFHYDSAGGPLSGAAQVRVLVGHDGWQNPVYTNMTRDPLNSNEWTCAYSGFPGGTRGLNYVFTDGGSLWDNNFSKDWYVGVACHSTARFTPAQPTGCTDVTVRYEAADGPLMTATQVYAHIGQNNWEWTGNPDMAMTRVGEGIWTCTFGLRDPAYNLNVCFNDGAGGWDTHFSGNWNVDVQNCHTNTGNAWIDPAQPSGCDPFTIYFEPVAGPLATATNINLFIGYDSWQGVAVLPMTQVSPGRWSVVYAPLRSTDWINFCFNNGQGTWDNNYTKDWNYSVYCPPQDGLVTFSPESPVGCVPLTITYQEQTDCPLENAAGVYVCLTNYYTPTALDGALPMTEISNGLWRADFYPPPGISSVGLYFHDNQGTVDQLRKTEYWYVYFQDCRPAGMLAITNPLCEWVPMGAAVSVTLAGQLDGGRSDTLVWSNALTGQQGTLPGTSRWEIAGVALQPGTNTITVGARVYGAPAFDSPTNSAYQDGWQVGDNGGFGFTEWTQYSVYPPLITVSSSSILGAKAWQFNKPASMDSYFYMAERSLLSDLLPGDSLRFKIDTAHQGQGLYETIDFITEAGAWLGSLAFAPYAPNKVTLMSSFDYNTLDLPPTTAGYAYSLDMLTMTSSVLTVTSCSSGQSIQSPINWANNSSQPLHTVSFFCMNYDYVAATEYIQMADLQVVPGTQGQWQSDTVNIISTAAQDQDTDGMPDDWETAHGLNPGVNDALADDDDDGQPNLDEYYADTHPGNSNSMLRINSVYVAGNALQLVWQGGSNATQIIQCSSNLESGWRDLLTNRPPTPVTNILNREDLVHTNQLFFRFKAGR